MKKSLLIVLCFLTYLSSWATDESKINSTIEEVTVYRQRAQITREASAKVKKGDNILVLSGLSGFILDKTIIVAGEGDGILQSVKHRVSYLNTTPKTPSNTKIQFGTNLFIFKPFLIITNPLTR